MTEISHDSLDNITEMLYAIGEDPCREGLKDTPKRVVKSWSTIFGGYSQDPESILGTTFSSDSYSQMIILKDIEMFSTCEHHMLPFVGKAHIAYIPSSKVVGISKLARLVECFSRRLQIQERLTDQIADALHEHTDCLGVGVMIESKHFCMVARGVSKQNSLMVTTALRGNFKDDQKVREEFLSLIK